MNYIDLLNKLKSLSHYESDIDTVTVWEQLESDIHGDDRARRVFYYRLLGSALSISVLVGISLLILKGNVLEFYKDTIKVDSANVEGANLKIYDNKSGDNMLLAREETIQNSADDQQAKSENIPGGNENSDVDINQAPLEEKNKYGLNREVSIGRDFNNRNQERKEKIDVAKQNATLLNQSPFEKDQEILFIHDEFSERFENKESDVSSELNTRVRESINKLPISLMSVKHSKLLTSISAPDGCPLIEKRNRKLIFSVRPYVYYDLPNSQLTSREGTAGTDIARSGLESNYAAYSFGVEIRAKTRSGFHIFTGINQNVIRDQFEYSLEKDTMILLEDVIKDISINANQDSVITIGDTIVNARVLESGRKLNTYRSIDIPIGIEFSKRLSKFEFGISTTALFNLSFSTEGSVADEDEAFISIKGKYKNSIGMRFRISTPIQYYIGQRVNLGIAPSFTLSPSSISDPNYPIEHKVNLFSIGMFADYSF